MYDLYLFMGCRTLPDLEDLAQTVPALVDLALQTRILRRSPAPGFLRLDLPADGAVNLFQRLRSAGALVYLLSSAYRQPLITIEQAKPLAERAIEELRVAWYLDRPFGPVHFLREHFAYWTFQAVSERREKLHAHVDKLDGHIWEPMDHEHLWKVSWLLKGGELAEWPLSAWAEVYHLYDIYLSWRCQILPDLEDLVETVPALADPALQARMLDRTKAPGFLGLDLPADGALSLLHRLRSLKVSSRGYLLPSAYRQPRITIEQATPIAEQAIEELQVRRFPDHTLGPVHFQWEQSVCWTFGAVSEQLIKEGRIPGALHASVDKLDGHIWKQTDLERLQGEG